MDTLIDQDALFQFPLLSLSEVGSQESPFLYCTFEGDDCGFQQEVNRDNADWKRRTGSTQNNIRPNVDHTTGTSEGKIHILCKRD